MKILKQNLGIDVDSKELKCNLQMLKEDLTIKISGSRTFKNTLKGFEELHKWIEKKRKQDVDVHFTLEVTGVYHENLIHFFNDKSEYLIHVVLPNVSRSYMDSLNSKSKTDKIDAKGLGQMGLERMLTIWKPVSPQMRIMKSTSRERLQLVRERTMVINQLHAENASFKPNCKSVRRYEARIKFVEKQISAIEKDLEKIVDKDHDLKERMNNVCTIKGVGFISAVGIVAEYNGFSLFSNRNQVVSYAGYDVVKNESGTSIRGKNKISKRGNSFVRQILHMPTLSAVRYDQHHHDYYNRIVSKTGLKMKGNVAIQRKTLLLIYTLFTNNIPYDPDHHLKVRARIEQGKNKINENIIEENLELATV